MWSFRSVFGFCASGIVVNTDKEQTPQFLLAVEGPPKLSLRCFFNVAESSTSSEPSPSHRRDRCPRRSTLDVVVVIVGVIVVVVVVVCLVVVVFFVVIAVLLAGLHSSSTATPRPSCRF